MINKESQAQFDEIFNELSRNLDITATQYEKAVSSYQAVGKWLSDDNSKLSPYSPEILPQGSFLLGTMIKPVLNTDELDVDLVCKLSGKQPDWSQFDLKSIVGKRLKENETYERMLDDEGRRCWTLNYADSFNYHMDILPAIVSSGYKLVLEKAFSMHDIQDINATAIRITDNQNENYYTDTNTENWNKSNPFGYAVWFQQQCKIPTRKTLFLSESVNPIPKFQEDKLPLQRVVQILKRHRDIMFKGHEDKPISIIITTLAAKAYGKEVDTSLALFNVVSKLRLMIEKRYSYEHGRYIEWISNPVNDEENFADKWPENNEKRENFYNWLTKLESDLKFISEQKGIHRIQESFSKSFGDSLSKVTFGNIADKTYTLRENENLHMNRSTGNLSSKQDESVLVKSHNFHGSK